MKLRLFPRQEDAYFPLFEAAADTIAAAATALLDLLTDLADPETKAKQLAELEHEGDRITRTILTRLASTFIARLDRDDIFELAERLDNVTDAIDDVGDMVFLHGITEPLDPVTEQARVLLRAAEHTSQGMHSLEQLDLDRLNAYLTAVHDLEYEGDQLHRRVRAQLDDFTTEHPAQHMLRWKDVTDGIEQALDELAHVAHTVEGIVLKHA
jgi:predicted phosphate transport protein (TIGR00153 family)